MESACDELIKSNTVLQQSILRELLDSHWCVEQTEDEARATHRNFHPFPSSSPGCPPCPHTSEAVSAAADPPHQSTLSDESHLVTVHMTLDAFDVLDASPAVGQALVTSPDRLLRPELTNAAERWARAQVTAPTEMRDPHRAPAASVLHTLPVALCEALRRGQVRMDVCLLVLRVPHFLTSGGGGSGVAEVGLSTPRARKPRRSMDLLCRSTCAPDAPMGSADHQQWSGKVAPETEAPLQGGTNRLPERTVGAPVDAALSTALAEIHCVGVVTAVFFASRAASHPLPLVKLRPMSKPPEEDLLVDLRWLGGAQRTTELAVLTVVGCVWDLRGTVSVAAIPARCAGSGGSAGKAAEQTCQYVVATTVRLPFVPKPPPPPPLVGEVRAADIELHIATAAAEERAAREAGVCWEGLRLALGVDPAPPPCPTGTLAMTDLVSLSLDAIVALLIALTSAHAPQDGTGVSLVLLDDAAHPFLPPLVRRLAHVAPSAICPLQPSSTGGNAARWSWQSLLPIYHAHTSTSSSSSSSSRRSHLVLGTGGVADELQTVSAVMDSAQESIRGGALTDASGRTAVVEGVDGLPVPFLHTLRECLGARPSVVQGEAGEDPSAAIATFGQASVAHERVVRRQGGQRVPFHTTRAFVGTLRSGSVPSAPVFELLRRVDVALRPSVNVNRRQAALASTTDGTIQSVLRDRSDWWARVAGDVLGFDDTLRYPDRREVPVLSARCSSLLRLYFLVARATYASVVDSSLMETLTSLTCCHASLRQRVTHHAQRRCGDDARAMDSQCGLADTLTPTHLIDAVVAIGLCDNTIYFLTKEALLPRCVFQILETGLAPASRASADAFVQQMATMTAWPPTDSPNDAFSVVRLADEIEARLCGQLPSGN